MNLWRILTIFVISLQICTLRPIFGQGSAAHGSPESPGPSSRRTGIAITEIMYKPAPRSDGKNLEFVEIYNSNPFYEDISGYRLDGQIGYTFPTNTILPGASFLVIAAVPADIQGLYGLTNVLGP